MSQNINKPKRFSLVGHEWIGDILEEKPDGDYVLYSDYAALAAEKEAETRATFDAIRTITQLRDDYAALKAEVERLRKAGDDMAHELHSCEPEEQIMLIAAWNAAKEGRDAK